MTDPSTRRSGLTTPDDYDGMFDLTGRRVAVVGAARGIGRECAVALAARGATVVAIDRDASAFDPVMADLGQGSQVQELDILKVEAVEDFVATAGHFDGLVFTPATNVRKRIAAYTDEDLRRVLELNLVASFTLLRCFASEMADNGGGSIVGFSSIRAVTVEPGQGVYAASKAALEMLLRTVASEYGPAKVRANAIRPGVVETALTEKLRENEEWRAAYASKSALGRWATPSEMAGAAVYLVSDASSFVTGSVLTVDGGWTAQDGRYDPPT